MIHDLPLSPPAVDDLLYLEPGILNLRTELKISWARNTIICKSDVKLRILIIWDVTLRGLVSRFPAFRRHRGVAGWGEAAVGATTPGSRVLGAAKAVEMYIII